LSSPFLLKKSSDNARQSRPIERGRTTNPHKSDMKVFRKEVAENGALTNLQQSAFCRRTTRHPGYDMSQWSFFTRWSRYPRPPSLASTSGTSCNKPGTTSTSSNPAKHYRNWRHGRVRENSPLSSTSANLPATCTSIPTTSAFSNTVADLEAAEKKARSLAAVRKPGGFGTGFS